MNTVIKYIRTNFKILLFILIFVIVLIVITLVNQGYIRYDLFNDEKVYENIVSRKVLNNDTDDINYDMLNNDLNSIDNILKEQLALETDKVKKSENYASASKIYTEKLHEYTSIIYSRLDDEDFERLQLDLNEFDLNLDLAIEDINKIHESNYDRNYYANKYMYEEKQKKCREILETYRGFLQ